MGYFSLDAVPEAVMAVPMPHLLIQNGSTGSRKVCWDEEVFSIGRHPEGGLVLENGSVSSRHAEIAKDGRRFILRDLGSANGTTVNRKRATEIELISGDIIHFGPVECVFGGDVATDDSVTDVVEGTVAPDAGTAASLRSRLIALGRTAIAHAKRDARTARLCANLEKLKQVDWAAISSNAMTCATKAVAAFRSRTSFRPIAMMSAAICVLVVGIFLIAGARSTDPENTATLEEEDSYHDTANDDSGWSTGEHENPQTIADLEPGALLAHVEFTPSNGEPSQIFANVLVAENENGRLLLFDPTKLTPDTFTMIAKNDVQRVTLVRHTGLQRLCRRWHRLFWGDQREVAIGELSVISDSFRNEPVDASNTKPLEPLFQSFNHHAEQLSRQFVARPLYVFGRIKGNLYEAAWRNRISGSIQGDRFVLRTTTTEILSAGGIALAAEYTGTRLVKLEDGFDKEVQIWEERQWTPLQEYEAIRTETVDAKNALFRAIKSQNVPPATLDAQINRLLKQLSEQEHAVKGRYAGETSSSIAIYAQVVHFLLIKRIATGGTQ